MPQAFTSLVASDLGQNFTWLANHRVPSNPGMIRELQRFSLNPLTTHVHLPFETVVALKAADENVGKMNGALQRLSPPEPPFAVLFSIRDAIDARAEESVLMAWCGATLSVTYRF